MYLVKTQIINAKCGGSIEVVSEKSKAFEPTHLQILVNEKYSNNNYYLSFVEISNITIMGTPQLVNFDGATNSTVRGNSLVFSKEIPVGFGIFGAHNGQGLNIEVVNPHDKDVEVTVLIKGEPSEYDSIGYDVNPSRDFLFNHFQLKAASTNKILINNISRFSSGDSFKFNKFQLICFRSNTLDFDYPYIKNLMVNGESQFENIEDVHLNSTLFKELRNLNLKEFISNNKGTYITLENPSDYELNCYMTLAK